MIPSAAMPPSGGIWDCHTHIYGPYTTYPLPDSAVYRPPQASFMELRSEHEKIGVKHGVIVQAACYGDDHRLLLDALKESSGAYKGVAVIHPDIDEASLAKMHTAGVRGIRIGLMSHLGAQIDLGKIAATVERIRPYGWHALIHGETTDVVVALDALAHREVPLVIDHMARVPASEGITQKAFPQLEHYLRLPQVWIKLSGADRITNSNGPYDAATSIARRFLEIAPERAIWGTDWPHPNIKYPTPENATLLDWVRSVCSDLPTSEAVLKNNPARLYA